MRSVTSRRVVLLGATMLVAAAPAGEAGAQTVSALQQVTRGSIFNKCTADHVAYQEKKLDATNYPNAAVEPNLAINPVDSSQLLFGVQQDRWSNGGSRGLRAEASNDGGATWKPSSTPAVTLCQRGPWQRASDPWVAFSADGVTAYMSTLTVDESADPNAFSAVSGQTVSVSHDGGRSWGLPSTLIIDNNINILNDKNAIAADAINPKVAYVVWDRLQQFVPGAGVADEGENSGDDSGKARQQLVPAGSHDGSAVAHAMMSQARKIRAGDTSSFSFPLLVKGPALFSRTLDGGQTWSSPTVAHDPGKNAQTIGNQIVTYNNGTIADVFSEINDASAGQPSRIGLVASTDKGATWSEADYAQEIVNRPAVTPNLQQPIRSADVLFSVAVDRTNYVTYLVWEDERFSGVNEVLFAFAGANTIWSPPVRISQTPRNPLNPLFQQALIPTVAVAADGTIGVTYYDFRNDHVGATTDATDYWLITCNILTSSDQCLSTGDWTNEVRLTDTSFDYNLAPNAGTGHFLGDYMGLKTVGQTFYSVFGQSPVQDVTSQYFRTVTLPAAVASSR